jgi:Ca-activated chloride channel homolog
MLRSLSSLVLALAAASLTVAAQDQQAPTFRGGSETVRVYATVTDHAGRLVTNLAKEQFEVRDDGKPQPIKVIQLIVLLDISGSQAGNLPLLRRSTHALLAELGPKDVARVGTFGTKIDISPEFTNDAAALEATLPEEIVNNQPTPLWRAIDKAMSLFDTKSDKRRVVMVMSDGKNADNTFSMKIVTQVDVIDRARAEDVMVYGIGVRSNVLPQFGGGIGGMTQAMSDSLPDPGLAKTAEETGGGYADVLPRNDLAQEFARVMREMHSQYLIGYDPPKLDGKQHKIEVRVTDHGLTPRSRKSYVAPGNK